MNLSIVSTLYNSAHHLHEFHERISKAAKEITDDYEIILVNDASPDNSLDVALELYERDPRVKVIDLARNYQHLKAMMSGLAHAKGERVFLVDCDLEEEPELLVEFHEDLNASGADVVYGVQNARKGGLAERLTGYLFYKFMNALSTETIPSNLITARLMSREYVAALVSHQEREIYLGGLFVVTGFRQVAKPVKKHSTSRSTYTLRKKMNDAVNGITSFSNRPLVFIFYVGMLLMGVAGPYLGYLLGKKFLSGAELGFTTIIGTIWFLGGLTIFMLGIIGIYLSKIFTEVKQRPYTIVRQSWEHPQAGSREFQSIRNISTLP